MCFGREIHNLRDYKHLQFLGAIIWTDSYEADWGGWTGKVCGLVEALVRF